MGDIKMDYCICGSDDGLHIKECPMWTNPFQDINDLIANQQREIDMLHAENALKLTQILGLEQLLYNLRATDKEDGSPCWCWQGTDSPEILEVLKAEGIKDHHDKLCIEARSATEPFWKGVKK